MKTRNYGYFGWREFSENRLSILNAYFQSKRRNVSRPVRTQHGQAGEAQIRAWLNSFLPKKYGVTSGFVIPSFSTLDYKLRHYDVIVYDALESPVVWIDADADDSENAKRRAIPAEHVLAVFEVKATFTSKHIRDVSSKLGELTELQPFLHPHFHSGAIFCELPDNNRDSKDSLLGAFGKINLAHFRGALILTCAENRETSATVESGSVAPDSNLPDDKNPICYDVDKIELKYTEGGVSMGGGCSVRWLYGPPPDRPDDKNLIWHATKRYGAGRTEGNRHTNINWSRNEFTQYWLDELDLLQGKVDPAEPASYSFGQMFDIPNDPDGG